VVLFSSPGLFGWARPFLVPERRFFLFPVNSFLRILFSSGSEFFPSCLVSPFFLFCLAGISLFPTYLPFPEIPWSSQIPLFNPPQAGNSSSFSKELFFQELLSSFPSAARRFVATFFESPVRPTSRTFFHLAGGRAHVPETLSAAFIPRPQLVFPPVWIPPFNSFFRGVSGPPFFEVSRIP